AAQAVGELALACALHERAFAIHEHLLGRAARSRRLSLQITHRLALAEWERDAARRDHDRLATLNARLQAQVAENDRLQQRLRAQALEDPLTGVHNRRHLLEAGPAMLAQAQGRQEPLALVMVDLDHFKRVNDQHGHELGDQVLRGFAQLARRRSRAEDLVCRYGGEEFVLLMAGADAPRAAERLRNLLQDFQALTFAGAHGAILHCSFSAGVVASGSLGDDLHELLAQADAALYRAKQLGRSRVELATAHLTA
ncbi:MAG: GGDEF domain-containing protein, partial [Burkholderiales bacterium]|nr:GGDEF domain-containing protein [Burkholderiales bacterium]